GYGGCSNRGRRGRGGSSATATPRRGRGCAGRASRVDEGARLLARNQGGTTGGGVAMPRNRLAVDEDRRVSADNRRRPALGAGDRIADTGNRLAIDAGERRTANNRAAMRG